MAELNEPEQVYTDGNGNLLAATYWNSSDQFVVHHAASGNEWIFKQDGTLDAPAIETDDLGVIRFIASGESLATVIEEVDSEGGGLILPRSRNLSLSPSSVVAPTTTNDNRVIISGGAADGLTIDLSSIPDQSNASGLIDLTSADNISFENLTVADKNRDRVNWVIRTGAGFRFDSLTLDTGSGGMDITNTDCHGEDITVLDQNDTNAGQAAAIHPAGAIEDVQIDGFEIKDCDRDIEVEDGIRHTHIRNGVIKNTDNSAASSPSAQKTLNVMNHGGNRDVRDVKFESIKVENCKAAPQVRKVDSTAGSVEEVIYEDITIIDSGDGVDSRLEAEDVTFENVVYRHPNIATPADVLTIQSGSAVLDGVKFYDVDSGDDAIQLEHSSNLDDGDVTIRDCWTDAGSTFLRVPSTSATYTSLIMTDCTMNSSLVRSLLVRSSQIDEFITVRDCYFGAGKFEIESGNGLVLIDGGHHPPPTNLSPGTRITHVGALEQADVQLGVWVEGITKGTYTGDGANPQSINLGAKPYRVVIKGSDGTKYDVADDLGDVVGQEHTDPSGSLSTTATGFDVGDAGSDADPNTDGETYDVIAWLEA